MEPKALLAVLLVTVTVVQGFPNGAPDGACTSLRPNPNEDGGHGAGPQNTAFPYQVTCKELPGNKVELAVAAVGNDNFRGLLAQVRIGGTQKGSVSTSGAGFKNACDGQGVTHTSRSVKTSGTFVFDVTANDISSGNLQCAITVVRSSQVYWVDHRVALVRLAQPSPTQASGGMNQGGRPAGAPRRPRTRAERQARRKKRKRRRNRRGRMQRGQ